MPTFSVKQPKVINVYSKGNTVNLIIVSTNRSTELNTKMYYFHDTISLCPFVRKSVMKALRGMSFYLLYSLWLLHSTKLVRTSTKLKHSQQTQVFETAKPGHTSCKGKSTLPLQEVLNLLEIYIPVAKLWKWNVYQLCIITTVACFMGAPKFPGFLRLNTLS